MSGSFSVALSGLTADAAALDVVGNNLANLNTTGYKSSTLSFSDLLAQSIGGGAVQIGGGVSATATQRQFTQGSLQLSGGAFDAAIQGNGFFIVRDTAGNKLYTRAGSFHLDANGNLVTTTGQKVQGWTAVTGAINTGGPVGNITIPSNSLHNPVASTQFSLSMNLQSDGVVAAPSGSFSAPLQVVDSLGSTHTLTINFTKTAANKWDYDVTIPGEDLTTGTPGTPKSLKTGSLTFDGNGKLTTPAAPGTVAIAITGLADGATDLNLNWNLYDAAGAPTMTQFAQPSALSATSQDGVAAAQLTQVSLANGGSIVAHFSDGTQQIVGKLAIAAISNPESLVSVGQSNFELGADSATPVIGAPGTGSRGTIQSGALESSTVDIAQEFTNLIVYQRAYQANSRVISTLDELTQDLLSLKR